MTEPSERDLNWARGHLTIAPWDRTQTFENRVEDLARAFAAAREEGRREERERCVDLAREYQSPRLGLFLAKRPGVMLQQLIDVILRPRDEIMHHGMHPELTKTAGRSLTGEKPKEEQ